MLSEFLGVKIVAEQPSAYVVAVMVYAEFSEWRVHVSDNATEGQYEEAQGFIPADAQLLGLELLDCDEQLGSGSTVHVYLDIEPMEAD